MIRLPPARSRVDLKLPHDGCNAASPAAGVDGGTILTAVTQPVRPPSLLVAESVRFERRVNAHQGPKSRVTCDSSGEAASLSATTTRSIIRCAGLLARRGRGAIEVRSDGVARGRRRRRARRHRRRPLRQSGQPGHAGSAPGPPGSRSSPKSGRSRPAPDPCRAYASELGRNLESRVTRIGPALLEPLARFSGPLPVSAASSSQIESSPVATKREPTEVGSSDGSDPSRARHAGRDAAKPR